MKIRFALCVLMAVPAAWGEAQMDFDPSLLPAGHGFPEVVGCISSFSGQPMGCFSAVISSGGVPFMYQAVFQADDEVTAGYFTSLTLSFECGGGVSSFTEYPAPFAQVYFAGPANPPESPTAWSGVDPGQDCTPPVIPFAYQEDFDHGGSLPAGWTVQSISEQRTIPWAPISDSPGDWSVATGHQFLEEVAQEWLISPTIALTWWRDLGLQFHHVYEHAGSEAAVLYSTNNGLSWNLLESYTGSESGIRQYDVSGWADGAAFVRLAFRFDANPASGGSSWRIDDILISGSPIEPVAGTPVPPQPAVWTDVDGFLGCTWTHPLGISGSELQLRVDRNGDGDYGDGPGEAWVYLETQPNAGVIQALAPYQFNANGSFGFEFRARTVGGAWGYSGDLGQEGIQDDWHVLVFADLDPPVFSNLLPTGQPDPDWQPSLEAMLGATITDTGFGVDGTSLEWRFDWDHDGGFGSGPESWQPLVGYGNGSPIVISIPLVLPEDGEYRAEIRAADLAGNQTTTGAQLWVRADATPPTPSSLLATGVGNNTVELLFSITEDIAFDRYQVHFSTDSDVTAADPVWGPQQDPGLESRVTDRTLVAGLQPGTRYWFRLWSYDKAGNTSAGSNTVSRVTAGTPIAPIEDLHAQHDTEGVLLSWSEPTQDINGSSPVAIQNYEVHSSSDPWFTPSETSRIAVVSENEYRVIPTRTPNLAANYRVVTVGSGLGSPVTGMALVSAGSFTMGPDPLGNGSAHTVSLTRDYWMDVAEVTNEDYREALQWAFENGHVTLTDTSVVAHGQELVNLNDPDCEIQFDQGSGEFILVQGTHLTEYGGPGQAYPTGYEVGRHPAKEVTWYGAACYCDWRSLRDGLDPYYNGDWSVSPSHNPYAAEGYRLPTEAEWEYAARFNDGRNYPWGDDAPLGCDIANLNCVGWSKSVGLYSNGTSSLGLHDLIGNALEYTNDFYATEYQLAESMDPIGPPSGLNRACRGSDFGNAALVYAMSTTRQARRPYSGAAWVGFRTSRSRLVNTLELPEMVTFEPGTFEQGQIGSSNATPVHTVTLTHPFELGRTEITNSQFVDALQWAYNQGLVTADETSVTAYGMEVLDLDSGNSQIQFNAGVFSLLPVLAGTYQGQPSGDLPVSVVSWHGAACYCDWLSLRAGLQPYYEGQWTEIPGVRNPYAAEGYRLPTESEWEYAAQFNDDRPFPWGFDTPDCSFLNYDSGSFCVGWMAPVGSTPAGATSRGLMDMAGNVWEWTNDWFSLYSSGSQSDPVGPSTGTGKVRRGGSWSNTLGYQTVGIRFHPNNPGLPHRDVGFRIARILL
jgi:formylglycine-generating enzyme required for sulfatase activity